jgi:tRNA dimethylallyltransferase
VSIPNIPIKLRAKIRSLHKKLGPKNFFSKLIKLDPLSKNRINSSDTQRAIRAYEVKLFTKQSIYDWFKNTQSKFENKNFYKIYLDYPRAGLIERINIRVKDMIKKGAISEVKRFIKLKVPKAKTASKAIGIEEIRSYLDKKIEIIEVIEKISIKTRQYAKRQSTWGRGNMKDWNKIESDGLNKFLKKI